MQTTQNTLRQIIALAMKILGTKNESELLQALSLMSEVGRTKFIKQCQNIIQTGNTSQESLQLAQLLALQALSEGPDQEYTLMAKYGKSLNRYYFGGKVKTYDGNYMDLKKPLNKDLVEGRESIGMYKGRWMYLNSDKIAIPKPHSKDKGYDGTAHINRAYNGMLIPKPYKYGDGGFFNKIGDFFGDAWNGIKLVPLLLKKGANAVGKGMEWLQNGSDNLHEKYGMNLSEALNTLGTGLAATFNKPAFNQLGALGNILFTNTSSAPQDAEEEKEEDKADIEAGNGKSGASNDSPVSTTPPNLNIGEDKKLKIINKLKEKGIIINDSDEFYRTLQSLLTL